MCVSCYARLHRMPTERPLKLTARQLQVLDIILEAITQRSAPPTRAEIALRLGCKSANAAEEHLKTLARKGVIELISGASRGIRVCHNVVRHLHGLRYGAVCNTTHITSKPAPTVVPCASQWELPLVGRVAAGAPILAQAHIEQTYTVESHLFTEKPDYLLKVRGMSMRDAGIIEGDLLAVRTTQQAHNGQIVVARLGEEVTVKRLHYSADCVQLLPENPDYPIIVVQPHEAFEIEGLVVGLIRSSFASFASFASFTSFKSC